MVWSVNTSLFGELLEHLRTRESLRGDARSDSEITKFIQLL